VSALRERIGGLRPTVVDGLLAVGLLIEMEIEAWLDTTVPASDRLITAAAAVLYAAPVSCRRKWPGAALVACAAVAAAQAPLGGNLLVGMTGPLLPPIVLSYTAGARLELRRGLISVGIAEVLFTAGVVVSSEISAPRQYGGLAQNLIGYCVVVAVPWLVGRLSRERARRAAAFSELAERVEREREQHELSAVAEERVRIGRELQDIIAQNVGAIIIQAGGARQLIHRDPQRATKAILTVERAGREALADLRRTLGLLREDDDPRALAPQPGLAQVGALLRSFHERGLTCKLHTEGEPVGVATGVDLLGYRMIEAALLTAVEHGSIRANVTVSYGPRRLDLEVRGDESIANADEQLRGICERVALYDGTLRIQPAGERGFTLKARLPLTAPER
jgi:signal transduction histidine kinase